VKTLHLAVHGGILAAGTDSTWRSCSAADGTIDLVAVNLYPFVQTVVREGVTLEEALENIDIGGPTMIRAAAKNFPHVLVLADPADYPRALELLRAGQVPLDERRRLALKAFQHVASYDTAIAQYLRADTDPSRRTYGAAAQTVHPRWRKPSPEGGCLSGEQRELGGKTWGIVASEQLHGKELSTTTSDAEAPGGRRSTSPPDGSDREAHNPVAWHRMRTWRAYRRALAGDPVSASAASSL
jgi:phosphoribosylaminoimidazolecarboxamide formyltransferase/IMP cyclohydrolase